MALVVNERGEVVSDESIAEQRRRAASIGYLSEIEPQLRGGRGRDIVDLIGRRTPAEQEQMRGRYAAGYQESPEIASINPEDYGDLLSELVQRKRTLADVNREIGSLQYTQDPTELGRRRLLEEYSRAFEPGQLEQPGTSEAGLRHLGGLSKMQRTGQLSRIQKKEKLLTEALSQRKTDTDSAIEAQLDRLLEEAGYQGGQARAQAGERFAERGLERSSFASRGIEDVTMSELKAKGELRAQAFQNKLDVQRSYEKTISDLELQKQKTRAAIESESESQYNQQLFMQQKANLENIYNELNARFELDAKDKAFTFELMGGIAKAGATAAVYGAAGGFSGGK